MIDMSSLPEVKGRYSQNSLLSKVTWFQVGGPAEVLFKPADVEDLCHFMANKPEGLPVTTIGVASNLLVRDGGIQGVVVRLGRGFTGIEVKGDEIHVGAGALDIHVATIAQQHELGGLEFLCGIPGTIGGALRMNAGAYGREIKDIFVEATAIDEKGQIQKLTFDDMGFSMRHTKVPEKWIFVSAIFKGTPDDGAAIQARMDKIKTERESTQPVKSRTGGSTFVNPDGGKAWQLIDEAGCRGFKVGHAQMSELHCNFMINTGGATADELERLGEEVRTRVKNKSGIELKWEIKRIGEKPDELS